MSEQQRNDEYDEDYADELDMIVSRFVNDKYEVEDYLKFIRGVDDFDALYNEAPMVKDHLDSDEDTFHQETYEKTMEAAAEWWAKKIDDYFNNSDTKLKEHFQRFLKDYQ